MYKIILHTFQYQGLVYVNLRAGQLRGKEAMGVNKTGLTTIIIPTFHIALDRD